MARLPDDNPFNHTAGKTICPNCLTPIIHMPRLTDLERTSLLISIETPAGQLALDLALADCALLDRKQKDYGPNNISQFGLFGVIVRMNDKFERLKRGCRMVTDPDTHLITVQFQPMQNESLIDTFADISNYGKIARLIHNGSWPTH